MDWKEIQSHWKEGSGSQEQNFSVPTQSKLRSLEREMGFFYQENGKKSSIAASAVFLLMAIPMLILLIKEGLSEFNLGYMIFLFVPVAISNLVRGLTIRRIQPEENLSLFLKSSLRDVRWIIYQQIGVGIMALVFFFLLFVNGNGEGLASAKAAFLILIPFLFILGVLVWWYQNHHPYNVYRLNKALGELVEELDGE